MSHSELRVKQRADSTIRQVIEQIEHGQTPPPSVRKELPDLPLLLRELKRLEMKNEVLYRKRQDGDQVTHQLVLPEELRAPVLQSLHNDMGHLGIDRTLDLVRTRFYWPRMATDVEQKVKTCDRCIRRKCPPEKAASLVNITTTRPLELVCMDFLCLEPDSSNTSNILVMTDHYTKFALALPTANQKSKTVARCLWDQFIVHYGIPERLHSDQGPDFEAKLIKDLCEISGIKKIRTTPYHPRGNPTERFNRTLLSMLGTLESKQKSHWKEYVMPLVHAYNCTRSDVTGFTPYELMFGRKPRLAVDLAFGLPLNKDRKVTHMQYVESLKKRLEESYKLASQNAQKVADKNKARFDSKITVSELEPGDRVLVRNVRLRGKNKLADKWEADIHVVVKRAGSLPVYTVKPESKQGPSRTLHRDLLLPCSFLPVATADIPDPEPIRRPKTRQTAATESNDEEELMELDNELLIPWVEDSPCEEMRFTTVHEYPKPSRKPDMTNLPDCDLPEIPANVENNTHVDELTDETPVENIPDGDNTGNDKPMEIETELTTEETTEDSVKEPENHSSDSLDEMDNDDPIVTQPVRRSERVRHPPKRLEYPNFGNPLVTVVKSLFQGLSAAFSESLTTTDYWSDMQRDVHDI
ncbi:protein NYNRIN-like [Salarias fasciatus]|uniref:protein NYNRIN-like n=1 Tax=Salarias fasciatus TaxID=181472 RepID=UPI0011765E00|nr:protein NYNRIN-like [Salarias fasciatus]XP_029957367.1 protein NYNRIN-like [Salarias fasciatus]XP_029957374.1 protein NYNRIN-like [Salarias fasciatus]